MSSTATKRETRAVLFHELLPIQLGRSAAAFALDRDDRPSVVAERDQFIVGIFSYR